jgi:hypothetical protein
MISPSPDEYISESVGTLPFLDVITVLLCLAIGVIWYKVKFHQQHPPGPSGLPLLGNALQIPDRKQWLSFHDWAKQYGDSLSSQ